MGTIHDEAYQSFFSTRPETRSLFERLLGDFDVTWASSRRAFGSNFVQAIAKPARHVAEMFGFERELMVVYADYKVLEPRIFQAAEAAFAEAPANGRVDPLVYLLISSASNLRELVRTYSLDSGKVRVVVPIASEELAASAADAYFVRNTLMGQLFSRDLFDVMQPVESDLYFFGRQSTLVDLQDGLTKGRNYGLFGLRKTGKTSLLLKLQRSLEECQQGRLVYLDLQDAALYRLSWWQLLDEIRSRLPSKKGFQASKSADVAVRRFRTQIEELPKSSATVIALDEIEHITPTIRMEEHWDRDFLDLWKSLRAIQNENRHVSFVVAGVNASVIETPTYSGHDNPLFAMAQVRYMPAFTREEVRAMVRTLGRSMGFKFDEDVYDYLLAQYGGHPALTRMACSHVHRELAQDKRPVDLAADYFRRDEQARDRSLLMLGEHILGLLKQWYPDEHTMLELLASGQTAFFQELADDSPNYAEHLRAYALVDDGPPPRLRIPLLRSCLVRRPKSVEHAGSSRKLDPPDDRLTEISVLRNRLEPLLRRYVKRTLKAHLGPERWIDPILKTIPTKERDRLQGVDRDEILAQRLFLLNLVTVIDQNWNLFQGLEACPPDKRVTKKQVSVLLEYVNAHREDAHAKDVSDADLATLRVVVAAVEGAVAYMLED